MSYSGIAGDDIHVEKANVRETSPARVKTFAV